MKKTQTKYKSTMPVQLFHPKYINKIQAFIYQKVWTFLEYETQHEMKELAFFLDGRVSNGNLENP